MSSTRATAIPMLARSLAYGALTKPDVSFLVVLTTMAGYYLGSRGPLDLLGMAQAVFGTTLVAAGTSALNQYVERDEDALMRRTASRPIPSGLIPPAHALRFGIGLCAAGTIYLAFSSGWPASVLALITCFSYLGAYTPLKKRTTLATLVGAFPGAVPPLIGWAAARGSLSLEAWILYAILFLWQFPHFMAIAWMYREDYARAGIQMLPVVDRTGVATFRQVLLTALALIPVSLLPAVVGLAGVRYFFGAVVLGFLMVQMCLWAARSKENVRAKWLMHATVIYLPLLLGLMMYDKLPQ
jgi:protoheme IX farnesyltransferase